MGLFDVQQARGDYEGIARQMIRSGRAVAPPDGLSDDHDWVHAFHEAQFGEYGPDTDWDADLDPETGWYPTGPRREGEARPSDVIAVLHMREGDNDGPDWQLCALLSDGRWLWVQAGCDYTGWD
jgi:hypothetical protein